MVQEQYWKELHELKTHIYFIELHLESAERIDRALKIVLAIASSSSIGAWVIWSKVAWLWAAIIAASHVISAISQYLPYINRIKTYSKLLNELNELMIQAEYKWHDIANGKLTPTEINAERFEIRNKKNKSLKENILTTIPSNSNFHQRAEERSKEYFNFYYHQSKY